MLRVLDLFSGIGGFSLGLERTNGFTTAAFCEVDPDARKVLATHWPHVPIHDDIRTLRGDEYGAVDVVCGGPPCQRTSVAAAIQGKRSGETMWPEMARIVAACRPRWVVIEQPAGNARWEGQVTRDLESAGYHSARLQRSARAFGAPHSRRRVFIAANAVRERCDAWHRVAESSPIAAIPWPAPPRGTWRETWAGNRRMDDGVPGRVARLRLLGNAVVPQVVEHIGRAILMAEHDDRCREYFAAEYDSTPETWDRLGTVHSGDCTGDAWTCDACVREDVERHVAGLD